MFGAACGGLLVIGLVRRLPWRLSCLVLLATLVLLDGLSLWIEQPTLLSVARFAHGLAGGFVMGFGAMLIARAGNPERTFALMLGMQMLIGGSMSALLAPLMSDLGVAPVWLVLIGFSVLCLGVVPLLSDYPAPDPDPQGAATNGDTALHARLRAPLATVCCAVLALFLYQAGQMGTFAYYFELGQSHGMSDSFLGTTNAVAIWLGVPTALFVAYWSTRSGYLRPIVLASLITAIAIGRR